MSLTWPIADLGLPVRGLKRAEYDRLVDLGFFENERVELLYGAIVEMSPANDLHAFAVEQLNLLLVPLALQGRARVRIQSPMAASDDSEPEPDVLVSPADERPGQHPERALLVIEVADSSLRIDRGAKAQLYAEAGVPEYWIVNCAAKCVEVFSRAEGGEYSERRRFDVGATLHPGAFADVAVPVARLFSA